MKLSKKACVALLLIITLALPLASNVGSTSAGLAIAALVLDEDTFSVMSIVGSTGLAVGGALGILCGIQLAVGAVIAG